MKKNPNIRMRKCHRSCFLIDITQSYMDDACDFIELNDIAEAIWTQIDGESTVEDITRYVDSLLDEKVPEEILITDVKKVIDDLRRIQFVED